MNWRPIIQAQIFEASKQRAIHPKLKSLAKKMLDGDLEFQLLYSSSRQQYVNIQLKGKLTSKTGRIILENSNGFVFKNFLRKGKIY